MLAITMKLEHIGHWIKMRQSLARFSASVSSVHAPSRADFIIAQMVSVHARTLGAVPWALSEPVRQFIVAMPPTCHYMERRLKHRSICLTQCCRRAVHLHRPRQSHTNIACATYGAGDILRPGNFSV